MSSTLTTLLRYKLWIDAATLQAISDIDAAQFAEKRHLGVRLENGNYPTLSLFFVHITIH